MTLNYDEIYSSIKNVNSDILMADLLELLPWDIACNIYFRLADRLPKLLTLIYKAFCHFCKFCSLVIFDSLSYH